MVATASPLREIVSLAMSNNPNPTVKNLSVIANDSTTTSHLTVAEILSIGEFIFTSGTVRQFKLFSRLAESNGFTLVENSTVATGAFEPVSKPVISPSELREMIRMEVSDYIDNHDFSSDIEDAVSNYDFSDAVSSAVEDIDMDDKISDALDSYDFDSAIDNGIDRHDFSVEIETAIGEHDFSDEISSALDDLDITGNVASAINESSLVRLSIISIVAGWFKSLLDKDASDEV